MMDHIVSWFNFSTEKIKMTVYLFIGLCLGGKCFHGC